MANAFLDKVQQVGKAVAGGVAGAVVSVLFTTVTDPNAAVNPDAPDGANAVVQLPNTQAEWVTFAIAVVLGFLLPFLKRNFPSLVQAEQQLAVAQNRVADGKQTQ
jgi:hypothetical protein